MSVTVLPPKVQEKLVSLYGKAQGSDDDRAKFAAAVRIAHEKGWPFRTLGPALGMSYEMARVYSTKDTDAKITESDLGFEIPERKKAISALPLKEVPESIVTDLKNLLRAAIKGSLQSRQDADVKPEVASFFAALAGANDAGWDRHSVGKAIGVHPQAVGRFIQHHEKFGAENPKPKYPKAPEENLVTAWNAKYPTTPPVKIPASVSKKMKTLQEDARDNRGNEGAHGGNPALNAAREYTALLGEWYLHGAARSELEQASGQGWEALRMRLSRWGYMTKPSWSPDEPRNSRRPSRKASASGADQA